MKIKRFIAFLLVLLLCVSVFPVSAFADDGIEENIAVAEVPAEQIIEEVESDPIEEDLIPEEPASANEEAEDAEIVEEGIDAEEEIPEDASAEDALAEDISEEEIVEEEPEEANDSEMPDSAITEDDDVVEVAEVVDEAIDEAKEIVEEVVTNDVVAEDSADDNWKSAGLWVISNGTLVPYNPNEEATRAIPSGIYFSDIFGAHGSDLNGHLIKAGGQYSSWLYGENIWWPSTTTANAVTSPYTGYRVIGMKMYSNDGPNYYKTIDGVLSIPIRPSQESGWSMDVNGYGNYTASGTGIPNYKLESLYTKLIPTYNDAAWTQISLVYGVARGMGGMTESGNTNITAAASTLMINIVDGFIGLGSDGVFHGKPLMTSSTAVNQQIAEILVRCEVYSKEKGLTGTMTGDNLLNALKGKGFIPTNVTGWFVKSGTASVSLMKYFQINKSQSSGNQTYIYGTNTITFANGVPVSLVKTSADTDESVLECIANNPLYTLEGAVYEIHEGSADGPVVATLTTNEEGKASSGDKRFAVNTVLYAKEIKAPSGYKLNERVYSITVSADSSKNVFNVSDKPTFDPNAITIHKTGVASERISGAVFKVEFFAANWENPERLLRTWYFESDSDGDIQFNEAHFADDTVYHSDPMFKPNGRNMFPLGCVRVQEVKAANGYVLPEGRDGIIYLFIRQGGAAQLSGAEAQAFWGKASGGEITGDEVYGIYNMTNDGLRAVNEEALTATMVKTSSDNNVEGFKFKLYQSGTHNSWYGVSDDKGNIYVTDELYQIIEPKTNVFENLTNGEYLLAEAAPGIYAPSEIIVSVVKTNEAGETVEEVVAKCTSDSEEYPIELTELDDGTPSYKTGFFQIDGLNSGDSIKFAIKNVKPEIKTFATSEGGDKSISAYSTAAVVMDKVSCENLVPGHKYIAMGELFDAATGESLGIKAQSAEVEATSSKMDINVKLVVDATKYKGKTLVVYEELKDVTIDMVVADHKDKNDKDQQVDVLSMYTTASGIGDKVTLPLHNAEIKDVVHMDNLIIGKQYTVSGKLVDRDTEEVIATAQETFEAKETSMDVTVIFKVDLREYAGKSVVVFEYLYDKVEITDDDQPIADHAELTDKDQTVEVLKPEIGTFAADPEGNKELSVRKDVELVDTVEYKNLVPGLTYELTGVLMNVNTKEPLMVNGKTVTVTETFVPTESNGTYEMHFKFDATGLDGFVVVVFEELKYVGEDGKEDLCEHKILEDLDQTVYFPEIRTHAADEDGNKVFPVSGTIEIVDTVNYKNLIVGKEYEIVGTLRDKATGNALKDADGNVITAKTSFVAESESGVVEVVFKVDASLISKYTVVVFETLYEGERELCVHADINDEAQTVYFPEIGTMLTDDAGKKNLDPKSTITLIDEVSYKNLEVDAEYILVGKIMDLETGKPLMIDGKEVVVEMKFTPKTSDGVVNMTFTFKGDDLRGKTLVAFEYLYREELVKDEDGNETIVRTLMAKHDDLKDKNQTVTFSVPTGDDKDVSIYWYILGGSLIVLAGLVFALIKVRKNKKKSK